MPSSSAGVVRCTVVTLLTSWRHSSFGTIPTRPYDLCDVNWTRWSQVIAFSTVHYVTILWASSYHIWHSTSCRVNLCLCCLHLEIVWWTWSCIFSVVTASEYWLVISTSLLLELVWLILHDDVKPLMFLITRSLVIILPYRTCICPLCFLRQLRGPIMLLLVHVGLIMLKVIFTRTKFD